MIIDWSKQAKEFLSGGSKIYFIDKEKLTKLERKVRLKLKKEIKKPTSTQFFFFFYIFIDKKLETMLIVPRVFNCFKRLGWFLAFFHFVLSS